MKIFRLNFYLSNHLAKLYAKFEPKLYFDERGYFFESWNQKTFNKNIGYNLTFVQDNQSSSKYSVFSCV